MKIIIALLALVFSLTTAVAQTNIITADSAPSSPSFGFWGMLNNLFDEHDTNSLIYAQEMNLMPAFFYDGETKRCGGSLTYDYWITDQQGVQFTYTQTSDRRETLSLGYGARTVFSQIEVGFGTGVIQDLDNPNGNGLQAYIQPSLAWRIPVKFVESRLYVAARVTNERRESVLAGIQLRFLR